MELLTERPLDSHAARTRWIALVCLLIAGLVLSIPGTAHAQQTWRGPNVQGYPGAQGTVTKIESDEYKLYFQTDDSVQKVFDFYRDHLQQQGFKVTSTKTRHHRHGSKMKAKLRRNGGSAANDRVELEVKNRPVRTTIVEIELDD